MLPTALEHINYMQLAIEEARLASHEGEVPIGAVIVRNNEVIAQAHNLREQSADPTAHAEILALRKAAQKLGGWRLSGTQLYVTIEPCPMCAGAMLLARVDTLVYGAIDPKAGAVHTLYNLLDDSRFNHQVKIIAGIEKEACGKLLQNFFKKKRKKYEYQC